MRLRVQHIVETRFSVLLSPQRPLTAEWLWGRIELLQRFCLPSLAAQTTERFVWAVFCDEGTDREVLGALRAHASTVPQLRLAMTSRARGQAEAMPALVDPDADVLITTRLDSDDALADDHLEAIQAYAEPFHRTPLQDFLLNFPRGLRLDTRSQVAFEDWMPFSSFHSLFERPKLGPARTVMHGGHGRLHYEHPTHQDESGPAWLIAIHGNNLVNRIRDDLPRAPYERGRIPGFTLDLPG